MRALHQRSALQPLIRIALVSGFLTLVMGCSMPAATPMPEFSALTETDSTLRFRPASFHLQGANKSQDPNKLAQILRADPVLAAYLDKADLYRIQVIFSQIEQHRSSHPQLTTLTFRQDENFYYPASLVKLPVAIFALERLEELGLEKNDRFEIHPANDCSRYSADACDTVEQCIEQIFVYSNNTAYNRLFEFLGRDEINDRLRDLGYQGVIQRRFRPGCGGDLGLTTGAVTFYDQNGDVRHRQPARISRRVYSPPRDDMRAGRQTRTAIGLIDEPMDFSDKNYLSLADFHQMLITLIDPSVVPEQDRFALNASDREFLRKTMAMRPRDAGGNQPDSFRKYLLIGGQARMPDTLQIINKVGLSYGFVSDVAYIRNIAKDVDFFLSATIYTNQNQIMNDAVYEYETLGFPFMRALGQAVYRYVVSRASQGGSPE